MPRVFISYAREDGRAAKKIYDDLKRRGFEPWIDSEDLLPGVRWKEAIKRAIEECDFFVALISKNSLNKRGFVQRELRKAMDVLAEVPLSDIFVIPIRLDECRPGQEDLAELNWVDLFPDYDHGLKKVLRALGAKPLDSITNPPDKITKSTLNILRPAERQTASAEKSSRVRELPTWKNIPTWGVDPSKMSSNTGEKAAALGDVIKLMRIKKSLSLEDVTSRLGLSMTQYKSIEAGQTPAEAWAPALAHIAIALETPTSRLIAESGRSSDAQKGNCGKLIGNHRRRKSMDQEQLSEATGLSLESIREIEGGKSLLEEYGPLLLAFSEIVERPVFDLFYPGGLPFDEYNYSSLKDVI